MTNSEKEQFLEQYNDIHASLMRFCMVKSRGLMDPKDLVNEVILIGLENYGKVKDKKALLSYLFTTASRICINKAKRNRFVGPYKSSYAEALEDTSISKESGVDISLLYIALDKLPPLQKEAVILFEISELPLKEIMVIQDSGLSAVKQRIRRGREKLATLLREKDHKKIAGIAALLFSSNAFSMSDLDSYFQAVKELPLAVSSKEAAQIINATNSAKTNSSSNTRKKRRIKNTVSTLSVLTIIIASLLFLYKTDDVQNIIPTPHLSVAPFSTKPISNVNQSNKNDTVINENLLTTQDYTKPLVPSNNVSENTNHISSHGTPQQNKISKQKPLNTLPIPTVKYDEHTVPLTGVDELSVEYLGGDIEIKTWDRNEVKIIMEHKLIGQTAKDDSIIQNHSTFSTEKLDKRLFISTSIEKFITGKTSYKRMHGFDFEENVQIIYKDKSSAKLKYFELNYTLVIPNKINLSFFGHYHEVIIPSFEGDLLAYIGYTDTFQIASVNGDAQLYLHNSNGTLGDLNTAKMSLSSANVTMGNANEVDIGIVSNSTLSGGTFNHSILDIRKSVLELEGINGKLDLNMRESSFICSNGTITTSTIRAKSSTLDIKSITDLDIRLFDSKITGESITNMNVLIADNARIYVDQIQNLICVKSNNSNYNIKELHKKVNANSTEDEFTIGKAHLSSLFFKGKNSRYNVTLSKPSNYRFNFIGNMDDLNYGNLDLTISHFKNRRRKDILKGYFSQGKESTAEINFDCTNSKIILK